MICTLLDLLVWSAYNFSYNMLYIEEKLKFTHSIPTQLSLPTHTYTHPENDTVAINHLEDVLKLSFKKLDW